MYCRICLKEGKEVNMDTLLQKGGYECPRCGNRIEWGKKDE